MSWVIDPANGDYIMVNGKPVDSDSLIYPAYYRCITPRGGWLHAPDTNFGSSLSGINRRLNPSDSRNIENIINRALKPMVDDGRAISTEVVPAPISGMRNNISVSVDITNKSGKTDTLELPPVGA